MEILDLMVSRQQVIGQTVNIDVEATANNTQARLYGTPEQVHQTAARAHQAAADVKSLRAEADVTVLEVLTPSQLRLVFRLLAKPVPNAEMRKSTRGRGRR